MTKIIYFKNKVYFIPYTRTESIESVAAIPEDDKITTMIFRTVLLEESLDSDFKMRVAIEEKSSHEGMTYALTAEVEYNQRTFSMYIPNKNVEDQFFNKFEGFLMYHLQFLETSMLYKFDSSKLPFYGSRDFRPLHIYYSASPDEMVVYKWDGYKCKFCYHDNILTYYDAKHNYCTGDCPILKKFENIVFQGELILEHELIIITDILGGFVNNHHNLYMPQPLEVIPFFEWFKTELKKENGIEEPYKMVLYNKNRMIVFDVMFQFKIDFQNSDELPKYPYDGYIIMQNANILKYKTPTIDVLVEKSFLKISGRIRPITDECFPHLQENKIYEIQQKKDGSYKILRLRYDRLCPATVEQYEKFLSELEFIRKAIRASTLPEMCNKLEKLKEVQAAK